VAPTPSLTLGDIRWGCLPAAGQTPAKLAIRTTRSTRLDRTAMKQSHRAYSERNWPHTPGKAGYQHLPSVRRLSRPTPPHAVRNRQEITLRLASAAVAAHNRTQRRFCEPQTKPCRRRVLNSRLCHNATHSFADLLWAREGNVDRYGFG